MAEGNAESVRWPCGVCGRGIYKTSPQSNLRRVHCKGPIGSDDSQVQDRPSPGKPLTPNVTLR